LGYIVSLKATEKAKAVATVLFVWFLFVLIYDLLLLTLLVADITFVNQYIVNVLIALNPTDLYRAINLIGTDAGSGSLAILSASDWGKVTLYLVMLLWVAGLMFVADLAFKRKPL